MKKITLKQAIPFSLLALVAIASLFVPALPRYVDNGNYDAADIAWVLMATALGLVVGAVAERIRFTSYILFIVLFSLLVYAPLAHWTWHPEGFLFKMGALDFAGGTVVHISAIVSNLAVYFKTKSTLDDTLDVFPCHGIGGICGMLLTGVFASRAVNSAGADGWWLGNAGFFLTQLKGMLIAVSYSAGVSFGIFKLINFIEPIRVSSVDEEIGLDATQHDEKYVLGTLLVPQQNGKLTEVEAY